MMIPRTPILLYTSSSCGSCLRLEQGPDRRWRRRYRHGVCVHDQCYPRNHGYRCGSKAGCAALRRQRCHREPPVLHASEWWLDYSKLHFVRPKSRFHESVTFRLHLDASQPAPSWGCGEGGWKITSLLSASRTALYALFCGHVWSWGWETGKYLYENSPYVCELREFAKVSTKKTTKIAPLFWLLASYLR